MPGFGPLCDLPLADVPDEGWAPYPEGAPPWSDTTADANPWTPVE
jgi:hypothetical protein